LVRPRAKPQALDYIKHKRRNTLSAHRDAILVRPETGSWKAVSLAVKGATPAPRKLGD
jgi:hypothetical protein